MGVASGLVTLVDETTIEVADLNLNFTTLTSSVNNIVSAQITDGAIVNADINASAEIAMSKITATASDATLSAALENLAIKGFVSVADGGATINVGKGTIMINGELRRNTAQVDTNPGTDPTTADWLDVWYLADTAASTWTVSLVDSGVAPGGSSNPGTNGRMMGSVYHEGSGVYSKVINYRPDFICGWSFINGDGSITITKTITHGKTFDDVPVSVIVGPLGTLAASEPNDITKLVSDIDNAGIYLAQSVTTTNFLARLRKETGTTFTTNTRFGFGWIIYGDYA